MATKSKSKVTPAKKAQVKVETTTVSNKPGRPVNPNSERQKRLAAMEARAKANGGEIKLGRPVVKNSARQQKLKAMAEKIANGYVPKRGRPKGTGKNQIAAAQEAEKKADKS